MTANEVGLADQFAIHMTLARYCHRCDDADFEGLVALFTADAVFTYGNRSAHGSAELLAFFRDTQSRPQQRGKHLTVNEVYEPDGDRDDRVLAASDFVFLRFASGRLVPAIAGRYHDQFVRVDGEWRIARREVLTLEAFG
ncbi:nuclear transport factor 2 family protein [Frankia sp. AgB1.9]|uniref:nuclear transport factor 2 family protein n=1 Tax=unclassified Frankia TaxID=2632575 RepID=UPI0019334B6A|nr:MULTISPECIES: nuclear transport factor 2 family protein [unclassified Frankia]MBL7491163.1 nuclear transport factor 2 family protein [Frankia sp. AgW1.1]MBL7548761.1 nuclear transport factor 2 family protein [Frankia sp. AgB1.9]MBL7623907.1 nuclear transport factor 2 family protein [Frankia sp. AgB1.8]